MDLERIKSSLDKPKNDDFEPTFLSLPHRFFEPFIMRGIKLQLLRPGRLICSLTVSPRLVNNDGNSLHGGAIATLVDWIGASVVYTVGIEKVAVSVEINVSYFDTASIGEEIEIEAKALQVGKVIAVVIVELRKRKTGKLIAHGRHTMYMAIAGKM